MRDLLKIYKKYPKLMDIYRVSILSTTLPKKICLSKYKCSCKEDFWYRKQNKKRKDFTHKKIRQGRPLAYPYKENRAYKTFQINYDRTLSDKAKLLLTSFKNKYIYYAIDDIYSSLSSDLYEKEDLISILDSTMIWLHNNRFINLFDIWIGNIYIQEEKRKNRFLESSTKTNVNKTKLILVLYYKIQSPRKKFRPLW